MSAGSQAGSGCDMCDLVSAFKSGGEAAVIHRAGVPSQAMRAAQQLQSARAPAMQHARAAAPRPIMSRAGPHPQQQQQQHAPHLMERFGGLASSSAPRVSDSMYASAREGDRVSSREMLAGMSAGSIAAMLYRSPDAEESRTGFVTPDRSARATMSMTVDSGMFEPMN
jgi:hypothetical protein